MSQEKALESMVSGVDPDPEGAKPLPPPRMQIVLNLARITYLKTRVDEARQIVDQCALFASATKVYEIPSFAGTEAADMPAAFLECAEALRLNREALAQMSEALGLVVAKHALTLGETL
jgi:hypothetical protein